MKQDNDKDLISQKLKEISQQDLLMITKQQQQQQEESEDDYTLANYDGF